MSKVLEGLAHELWAAAQLAPGEGIADGVARLSALLAQPAEAEGVEARLRTVIDELKAGFVVCQQCGDQEDTATLDCVPELEAIAAALSAVTAERDRLREAAGKAIAWFDAEQNESGVGINRRIKLCRDAENSLRAAMADQGGDL